MNPNLNQQPRQPWPWVEDTALGRARRIAVAYREHLRTANPTVCAALDNAMTAYGETWVCGAALTVPDDELVTTADAAELVGVDIETIRQWRKRGYIGRDGARHNLKPDSYNDRGWPLFLAGRIREVAAATTEGRLRRRNA